MLGFLTWENYMSRKIAFSVWPTQIPNNTIPEKLIQLREQSVQKLKSWGWEVELLEELNDEVTISMIETLTFNKASQFTKVSDWMRVVYMHKLLSMEDVQEVFYFDFDMLILESPSNYGCCIETHLQQDQLGNPIDKYWLKGVNSCYYLSKDNLPQLEQHISDLRESIVKSNYNPKFCYPMNNLHSIEEIGYVEGYWNLGSFNEPTFCSERKVYDCLMLWKYLTSKEIILKGYNLMGFRDLSQVDEHIELTKSIFEKASKEYSKEYVERELFKHISPSLRIRPNYNSDRKLLSSFKSLNKSKFKGISYE